MYVLKYAHVSKLHNMSMEKIFKPVREVAAPLAEGVDNVFQAQGQRIDVALSKD